MAIHEKPLSMRTLPSVRQLRAFVAVYHGGGISAAAEQLSLTQPAVTVLLRELEAKLGVRLFDRTTRSVRRTEAAGEAIAYAERALAELEAMGASMAELAGKRRGRLRVAATSTVAQTLLPQALRRYLDTYPDIQVAIEDVAPTQFVETLLAERADLGLGTLEGPVAGLTERVIVRDTLAAVAPASDDFPAGVPITWKQLAKLPVVTVKPGYGVRRRIEVAAQTAGVRLQIVHEVSLLTTAVAMAASRLGVAVVPASLLEHVRDPRLVARKLTRPAVERHTSIVHRTDRALPPPAQAFTDLLAREFAR
jgi:DNA-binding transcriptional LysR family regulator